MPFQVGPKQSFKRRLPCGLRSLTRKDFVIPEALYIIIPPVLLRADELIE